MADLPFPKSKLPHFNVKPEQIVPTVHQLLEKNKHTLNNLLSQPGPFTWENLMQPLEEMGEELSKYWSPISHLHSVAETDSLRTAYNEALPLITAYHTEVSQNSQLFNAISSLTTHKEFAAFNPAQRKILENDIRDFKLAGIHLPADKKEEVAALQKRLSQLMTTFSENLLDATHAWTLPIDDSALLAGLPQPALQLAKDNAKQRGVTGYVFTLDYPSYSTAMKYLQNRELRQKLYEAYSTRASDQGPLAGKWDNSRIMEDILKTRQQIAALIGFENYAYYSLATKMAKTPHEVFRFLYDLLARSKPIAQKEYQEIAELANSQDGISPIEVWDIPYYSEKLRESKFAFTQEDVRPYFPIDTVLAGMFALVKKIYGIRIKKEEGIDVWHPEVQFFSIYDEQDNLRAGFYIDLYARPHKRDGAWMDECRARRIEEGKLQYPVAYLTCNFMPPHDNQPALLTHDDVLTLFHEFGHCLHHMLTKINFPAVGGINGVPWDAIEFPSQFMENYCWEKESLSLIAKHYQTGEALPDTLYQKMLAAKHFQTGLQMVRQIEFSLFDFHLHMAFDPTKTGQIQTILNQVREEAAVIPVPEFNRFQHSFSHIFAGGYAAGYYSYKWAEVLSSDAYGKFMENGIFDPTTGRSFMTNILETGGVRDPMQSFVAFRGREPTIDALLQLNGITSQ